MDYALIEKELNHAIETNNQTAAALQASTNSLLALLEQLKNSPTQEQNALVSDFQKNCLFAISEANGVPRFQLATALVKFGVHTGYTGDVKASDFAAAQAEITALAQKFNPHYPTPRKLKNGDTNPDWLALING